MKTAIIGTGFIAELHKNALCELGTPPDFVIGRTAEKAAAFAAGTGARVLPELTDEVLREIDCAILCTPPAEHTAAAVRCLEADVSVFCEKPLCLGEAEAETLADLAEKRGVLAVVDYNNRFYPSVDALRCLARDVQMVSGTYLQQYHVLPAPYSWRYTDPMRAVTEIGSHLLDLIGFVTGKKIVSVRASFVNTTPRRVLRSNGLMYADGEGVPVLVENEDAASVDFAFAGGGGGHIELSEIATGHENDLTLTLTTPRGELTWSNLTPHELNVFGVREHDGGEGGFTQTFRDALAAFYRSAESGVPDTRLCTFAQAAENVRICRAIYRSAHSATAETAVDG